VNGSRPPRIALAFLAALSLAAPAAAQPAADIGPLAPSIRGVLKDSQLASDRLKMVLDLTTPEERKQYATLKDFVDVFLYGVDVTKPVRMDVLTGGPATSYRLYVPVRDFTEFWKENLKPLGIPVQEYAKAPGLFRLGGHPSDAFDGYMLYDAKKRDGYAIIWEKPQGEREPTQPTAEQQNALGGIQDLLKLGYDAVVQLTNKPEGVKERNEHFARDRDKILGKLKRDPSESAADFELRKFAAGLQFDETRRIYAESKDLLSGITVSSKPEKATGKLHIEPLPGTSLAESVAIIGQKASRFAGVPRGEKATATGRINFPLDDFRKKSAHALADKIRRNEQDKMANAKDATADQKAAGKEFIDELIDRINEGVDAGVIDGFVEITPEPNGVHTLVGGIASPDGTKWTKVIELLPRTRRGAQVKMNVGEHNGVALHELTLTKEQHQGFYEMLGGGRLLAGTAKDSIWYAAGPNAEAALKKAIDDAAKPGQPAPTFISFRGELLPGAKILDTRLGLTGNKKYRDLAVQAFQDGEGRVVAEMKRNGDAVDGEMTLDRGILRFIGKALSLFSKENLAD
jgi:hypothetical protein